MEKRRKPLRPDKRNLDVEAQIVDALLGSDMPKKYIKFGDYTLSFQNVSRIYVSKGDRYHCFFYPYSIGNADDLRLYTKYVIHILSDDMLLSAFICRFGGCMRVDMDKLRKQSKKGIKAWFR